MSFLETTLKRRKQIITAKGLSAVIGIAISVALPQLFHTVGILSGLGAAPGAAFLPMHIAVFFVGFTAGPLAGAITGALSPLISFALTGMPSSALLPFMVIELAVYGLSSGLLRNVKMPSIVKVLISQASGRLIRAAAILLAFYAFKSTSIQPSIILTSIVEGLPGLILQWTLLPLLLYRTKGMQKYYE